MQTPEELLALIQAQGGMGQAPLAPQAPMPQAPMPPAQPGILERISQGYNTFNQQFQNDPMLNSAMINLGTSLMQPIQPGQTPAGQTGMALQQALEQLKAERAAAGAVGREERKLGQGDREMDIDEAYKDRMLDIEAQKLKDERDKDDLKLVAGIVDSWVQVADEVNVDSINQMLRRVSNQIKGIRGRGTQTFRQHDAEADLAIDKALEFAATGRDREANILIGDLVKDYGPATGARFARKLAAQSKAAEAKKKGQEQAEEEKKKSRKARREAKAGAERSRAGEGRFAIPTPPSPTKTAPKMPSPEGRFGIPSGRSGRNDTR